MPLPKVSRSLPKWPDPTQSIGRQVMSRRLGRRRAWWPRGPALETFEKEIRPAIHEILEHVALCDADILIIPYMIGRGPDKANPVIMICCTNRDTRNNAEDRIRSSGLLDKYPGFGLGAAALPLESSVPSRLLGGGQDPKGISDAKSYELPDTHERSESIELRESHEPPQDDEYFNYMDFYGEDRVGGFAYMDTHVFVLSPVRVARIGVRLHFEVRHPEGYSPYATGGVIIEVNGKYFQLTISHFSEAITTSTSGVLPSDEWEDCHFDVSADDSVSDGSETETQCDLLAATSRGSMSSESLSSEENTTSERTEEFVQGVVNSDQQYLYTIGLVPFEPTRVRPEISLDYTLVRILTTVIQDDSNEVKYGDNDTLRVRKIADIGAEECAVVVITSSVGPIMGILRPGAISYRPRNAANIQEIFQVKLEASVVEGDCGAAIIDKQTGDLYGHLFLGETGSRIAYLIPATDVFQDISKVLGGPVTICGRELYNGSKAEK